MTATLAIIGMILTAAPVAGFVIYLHQRRVLREQKNFERGLKMVPMLIHLPPLSEDTDEGGRDARDVIDENISKAQILYSIIASTWKKGFKGKFYGQRHFAFEIVGTKGVVQFYAAVPISLVDVVKQAVISAYPSAQLEEVAEHNIFSPVGKISGTVGGELSLKEKYAYPIATYQEIKRDAMQSILNALSTLDKDDGAAIQILMRPAAAEWRKSAQEVASKKRKGEKDKSKSGTGQFFHYMKQVGQAAWKPPEAKNGGGDDKKKELSSLDQAILDSIDDKTRYPGYEVLIRVVASSSASQRAQTLLNHMVAAFSLFDAPGKNGFKYTAAADVESFVTAYILRFFPQENVSNVLNSVELATLFHFPDQKNIPTSQLSRQASKQVDGPRNMPEEGLLLGYNVFRGVKKPIRLSQEDRRRHMYVVGQTGVGKSIFLENIALQDMLAGRGFAFVDPHGDTVDRLVSMVPRERTEDVIYFSPDDMEYPMGLNLFEFHSPEQKDFLIQEAIGMLYKLYDPQHQGIIGPRYENWFRNIALTVMAQPEGGTFIDIPTILNNYKNKAYLNEKLSHVTDPTVKDFWFGEIAQTSDYHISEVLGWFVSKFGAFRSNEMMRNIIGQTKSAFNLREVMDEGKILFVNLSKGRTGELNSQLLGMIFVMKFQAAAMSRASIPEKDRRDFCLYVDEFQNFSTDSFATILSEARKYRLNLIVANQFTTQLTDEIRDAVFGNVGSMAAFRVGADADADALSKKFQPVFEREDILRLPNYNVVMQMLIGGIPTQPFSMATIPPLGNPNEQLGTALKQLSATKYGRKKSVVEAEIKERIATVEPPKGAGAGSPFGAAAGAGGPNRAPAASGMGGAAPAGSAPAAPGSGSFLDEWLNKRQKTPPPATAIPSHLAATPVSLPPAMPAQPAPMPASPIMPAATATPTMPTHPQGHLVPSYTPPPFVATHPAPSYTPPPVQPQYTPPPLAPDHRPLALTHPPVVATHPPMPADVPVHTAPIGTPPAAPEVPSTTSDALTVPAVPAAALTPAPIVSPVAPVAPSAPTELSDTQEMTMGDPNDAHHRLAEMVEGEAAPVADAMPAKAPLDPVVDADTIQIDDQGVLHVRESES